MEEQRLKTEAESNAIPNTFHAAPDYKIDDSDDDYDDEDDEKDKEEL